MATTPYVAAAEEQQAPPARWDASHMPRQTGRIAIVTGANSGIGYVTARELARKGAHVVLACRSQERGLQAETRMRQELEEEPDAGVVEFMQLDVSSLANVHDFVQSFKAKFDRLHILVNNAGIMAVPYTKTADGFESQFATNHLGPFALTALLFPSLQKSAPSRIVNVSSVTHKSAHLDLDEIMTPEHKYRGMSVYGNTKLCNLLFTLELSRRLEAKGIQGVMSVAAHPGNAATNVLGPPGQTATNVFARAFWGFLACCNYTAQSADMGSLPTLYAATAPWVQPGQYFGPKGLFRLWGYPALEVPENQSQSEEAAAKLWEFSERLTKVTFAIE